MILLMGKKAKLRTKHAAIEPLDSELAAEAAYYSRKCGITLDEAAKIIREANGPKPSIVLKDDAKAK
jgi:hypothetical protein